MSNSVRSVALADLASIIGQPLPPSPWLRIEQEHIDRFADLTGDHQWVHVDVPRATEVFGTTIAHGFHMLSLIPTLSDGSLEITGVRNGLNYGLDRLRFTAMVRCGSRARLHRQVLSVDAQRGGWMTRHRFTLEIENEPKPAFVADALILLFPENQPTMA